MKKILFVFLCGISMVGCFNLSAPTATTTPGQASAPTISILSTSVPRTPPPGGTLDVKNVTQSKQGNDLVKTASIAATQQNLGVGQIELSYPETMVIGESRNLRLRLTPAQQLVTSKKEPTTKQPANSPNFVYKFSGNVDLYPVMIAQLNATTFDIAPNGPVQQQVVDTAPLITWVWSIKPKSTGHQELALIIAIPAVVSGTDSQLSRNLQDLSIVIDVQSAPTNLTDQILTSIANNSGAIVVALIGLFGAILGIIIKMRADKENKKKL